MGSAKCLPGCQCKRHSRRVMSVEDRAAISERMRGNTRGQGNLGKRRTEEQRARIGAGRRGKAIGNGNARGASYPTYSAAHESLRLNLKKSGQCSVCFTSGPTDWAFSGEPGGWSMDPTMYSEMCRSCHFRFDGFLRQVRLPSLGMSS